MYYPAQFILVDGGYTITFSDFDYAISQGDSLADAHAMATDCLMTCFDDCANEGVPIALPSSPKDTDTLVKLPLSVWLKVLLHNALLQKHITKAELARRMGLFPQQVTKITDFYHSTKLDTLENAFNALGIELSVSLR